MNLPPVLRICCWIVPLIAALGLIVQGLSPAGGPSPIETLPAALRLIPLVGACAFALVMDGHTAPARASRPANAAGAPPSCLGGRPTSVS